MLLRTSSVINAMISEINLKLQIKHNRQLAIIAIVISVLTLLFGIASEIKSSNWNDLALNQVQKSILQVEQTIQKSPVTTTDSPREYTTHTEAKGQQIK